MVVLCYIYIIILFLFYCIWKNQNQLIYGFERFHNRNWRVLQNQIPAQLCNLQWLPFQTIVALSYITLGRLGPLVIQQFAEVQRKRDRSWDPCKIFRFPKAGTPSARYPTFLKYIWIERSDPLNPSPKNKLGVFLPQLGWYLRKSVRSCTAWQGPVMKSLPNCGEWPD